MNTVEEAVDKVWGELGRICYYYVSTKGIKRDDFIKILSELNGVQKLMFWWNFRNRHPEIFK